MFLIVMPNPSLDKTVILPGFSTGQIFRAQDVLSLAGGKGLNFARALQTLGQSSLVVLPIHGLSGHMMTHMAAAEGLRCDGVQTSHEVRSCLTIIDPTAGGKPTEIYEQGAILSTEEWHALVAVAARHFAEASILAVCGSFPPGIPEHGLHDLVQQAKSAGLAVYLDTYGPHLTDVLSLSPDLVKINQFEAAQATGTTVETVPQALNAARLLQQRGAQSVVITLGSVGAVGISTESQSFAFAAPSLQHDIVYTTGSGDTFFAGISSGLAAGQSLADAARLGIATGAANTLKMGAGLFDKAIAEKLLATIALLPEG
jgi:1-phosphofructokinase family hexose kinase